MTNLHSLANYPLSFNGTIISPTKICLQFQDVQCKLRVNDAAEGLGKMQDNVLALPIRTDGSPLPFPLEHHKAVPNVKVLAVGCQMPLLEEMQLRLITAYMQYGRHHSKTYKNTYNKEFIEFLHQVQTRLTNAINVLQDLNDEQF